eukprot:CAMPEP_0173198770 /NCGR_PEP_ID=MMETSP1141-20130122/16867_1 /TAXON_ID=483371 /ORGANISM="non described non described, Strain CCMP2298" /LENGTH=149 /DNA_ID=CAMNT_0014123591 /DNA_START=98 /DNA_END=547 /DNA_ORIENTATION=-
MWYAGMVHMWHTGTGTGTAAAVTSGVAVTVSAAHLPACIYSFRSSKPGMFLAEKLTKMVNAPPAKHTTPNAPSRIPLSAALAFRNPVLVNADKSAYTDAYVMLELCPISPSRFSIRRMISCWFSWICLSSARKEFSFVSPTPFLLSELK